MTFLQSFVLWGLPLLLVPIIIHLVNRMRHRTVHWAAMQFLLRATQSSTSHAKLRQFLILALRVLAVVALVFFLARPLAGGWLGWALAPAPDSILLLLDRSASMETRVGGTTLSKREAAVQRFVEAARVYEKSSHVVLIDSATRQAQEISVAALEKLPQVAATDTAADLPAMLQTALKWLVDTRSGAAEIWIASDLQESNWAPDDGRWKSALDQFRALPQKVRFRILSFESAGEANASISLAEMVRRDRAGQASLAYVLDLQRAKATTDAIPIAVTMGDARMQTEVRSEGTSIRWRSTLALDPNRVNGWGAFELPQDSNPRDNAAYFVYGERMPLRATVVAQNAEAGRILSLAASDVGKAATILSAGDAASLDLATQALIVWQAALPAGNVAERLRAFVEEGGVVLFLPPGEASGAGVENLSWGEVEVTRTNAFKIARWDEEQGPLAKTEERISLPVSTVEIVKRQKIAGAGQVMSSFADGSSFLMRKTLGRGEIYFCGSLPVNDWSTLSDGDVLVPMVQRMLQSGAGRLQNAVMATCGDLPPGLAQMSWTAVSDGARDPRLNAGVYKAGERFLAVNRPAEEDAPERIEASNATALFGDLPAQVFRDVGSRSDQLQGEIWRLFLFGMLLFLLAEGWLILPQRRDAEEAPRAAAAKPRAEAAVAS
jgi:hypothetical protein